MATLHVLRVFTDAGGGHGNALGVFLDGAAVPEERRQTVAAELGFSETVFVDDVGQGSVRIYAPALELPFAGHPLVGTAWLLAEQGIHLAALQPPAGRVACWRDDEALTWIRGRADWAPPMELRRFDSPGEVDALDGPPDELGFVDAWAWEDEQLGHVRARVFAAHAGVFEDEATGAAAVRLASELGRPITIRQGQGSVLHARPGPQGTAEVGGAVVRDEVIEHSG